MPDQFPGERRPQEHDRTEIDTLERLQQRAALERPTAQPQHEALFGPELGAAGSIAGRGNINPLYVLLDFVLAMVVVVILQLVMVVAIMLSDGLVRPGVSQEELLTRISSMPAVLIGMLISQALILILAVWLRVRKLRKLPWSWLGLQKGMLTPAAFGWGVLGGVLFLAINAAITLSAQGAGLDLPDQNKMFPLETASPIEAALMGLGVIVFTPLWEELFFRGYATRVFIERFGTGIGLVCSALLFAVPHLLGVTQGGAILLPAIFLAGLVLGWIYWRTRNLAVTIISHMIVNFLAYVAFMAQAALQ
jgi:membrane protease YdiL (CAAX protease family)